MNLDRNRVVMIFGIALAGAALLTWLLYTLSAGSKQQKLTSVYAAARDLPAGTRLKKTDIRQVSVVDKDIPRGAVMEERILLDRVLLFPLNTNEAVTVNKLASSSGVEGVAAIIEPGKRAVSVSINDTTGVAGLVGPRSHVDVLFTRTGSMAEAATTTVLQDVTVLSVGRVTEISQTPASGTQTATNAPSPTQNRAVTLLVTPEQAEKLELAKNQGKISLALRNPLDKSASETTAPTTAINLYDPTAVRRPGLNPFARGGGLPPGAAGGGNRNLWSSLTGEPPPVQGAKKDADKKEPPPKPRFVVDVYRGDKHVQEIFQ
jgi:pilus assembly protein CpaB